MRPFRFEKCRKYAISKLNFEIFRAIAPRLPNREGYGSIPIPHPLRRSGASRLPPASSVLSLHPALPGNKADL